MFWKLLAACALLIETQSQDIKISLGNILYVLVDQDARADFIAADSACRDFNSSFGLAQVSSQQEFDLITQIFDGVLSVDAWIGLRDLEKTSSRGTGRFSFTDGTRNNGFFDAPGEFPWLPGQPDNPDGNEHCVKTSSQGWSDAKCSDLLGFWCSPFRSGVETTAAPTTTEGENQSKDESNDSQKIVAALMALTAVLLLIALVDLKVSKGRISQYDSRISLPVARKVTF